MKVPSLKSVFEYALQKTTEDLAVKRPDDVEGYDKELDQLYQDDDDQEKNSEDLMIRRIS
jgi:hypothetical protein